MATKGSKKGSTKPKTASVTPLDPFEAIVEGDAAPKVEPESRAKKAVSSPASKQRKAEPKAAPSDAQPRSKRAKKDEISISPIQPFAEIAGSDDLLELPKEVSRRKRATTAKKTAGPAVEAATISTRPTTQKKIEEPRATSPTKLGTKTAESSLDVTAEIAATQPEVELSPVFKALAEVKLPELARENRARLAMQSPTRLHFYWSLRTNPWQQLRSVFGADLGSYTLVLKLRNLTHETEQIHAVEAQGEWWFNEIDADCEYIAEIGFYATNRPYFRVLYSNTVTTPRRSPSPHPASEARWTVSATKFAEVLDASGFTRDAVEVAIAGDDPVSTDRTTHNAFSQMIGSNVGSGFSPEDLRHAMLAIAGEATLEELRFNISATLFARLQAHADKLSAASAREVLTTHFDIDESAWEEHEIGPNVFGASLVNFSKTIRPRKGVKYSPRYNPVSSYSLGR